MGSQMSREEHYRKLERLYLAAPTNAFYGPSIRISEGEAEIVIPVRSDFYHAADAVHGSVYFKALDDACFFAVNSVVTDVLVLTVTFNIYFTRPASEGELRATARLVHGSRRLFVSEGTLVDASGRQLARGGGSFMRSDIRLNPEAGYE